MDDRSRAALWLPLLAAFAVVAVYAAQIGLGRWQTDEYQLFLNERIAGWHAVMVRLSYSPRPVSELLIYAYGRAVLSFRQPLVVECLAALWGVCVGSLLLAAGLGAGAMRGRWLAAAALSFSYVAFVLVTNPVTEAFYWPAAALAYMPTFAGSAAALFLLGGAPSPRRPAWCGVALLVTACSSEVGAAVAIGLAAGGAGLALLGRARIRPRDAWWIVPGLAGLWVMWTILHHRGTVDELGAASRPITGHLLLSLAATARQLAIDAVSAGKDVPVAAAVAAKLLFAVGFALCWARSGRAQAGRWMAALAAGLFAGAFFSLLGAYYHYGDRCCERQATTREALLDLMFVIGATAALTRIALSRVPGWLGPVLLAGSLFPFVDHLGAIRADFASERLASAARARTWASAGQSGTGTMKFFLPPDGNTMLIRGTAQPIGTFDVGPGAPDMLAAAGRFFGKTTVISCEPWQTEKSWLLRGQFIPACPAHGGPPDIVYDGP